MFARHFTAMGPRAWATVGNVLRIYAVFGYLAGAVAVYWTVQRYQEGSSDQAILNGCLTLAILFLAILFWNAKGWLVHGDLIARLLAGIYMMFWVVSSLGTALIFLAVVYFFTGEPSSSDTEQAGPAKPRHKQPANWQATGRVGASGAMVYSDTNRQSIVGMFESFIPVQVLDRKLGLVQVLAASGERGWIDSRTVIEGV